MAKHVFVGFGFGPIQSGLFAHEAYKSGNFKRIVISEIDQNLVDAVRTNGGTYYVNIAHPDGIKISEVKGIELLNPQNESDRQALKQALAEATEIVTSLPSVKIFTAGGDGSVAVLIADALKNSISKGKIIYTGENNNHAAELLEEAVLGKMASPPTAPAEFLNTVIGKMSQVVTEPAVIASLKLKTIAPGINRAFLVEAFNKILVTRCYLAKFRPGIEVFMEKEDLLPFEEAKLYGHNAIHALLAYLGAAKGYEKMTELKKAPNLMEAAHRAFLDESGAALIKKYAKLNDPLFTPAGYQAYVDDLLVRMTNPYLEDTIARAGRDPVRKLGYQDRIYGTMVLALEQGIEPVHMALGALAGLATILKDPTANELPSDLCFTKDWRELTLGQIKQLCQWLWKKDAAKHADKLIELTQAALPRLGSLLG